MERPTKTKRDAGADNTTPSIPQYFSWINNTNEGSTEKQTLINLEFFSWMKETFGMEIKIYAWDAGNFDGAGEGYGNLKGEKFKSQYPEGYKNVVAAAEKPGIRFGLWGSPDGFGDDEKTEKERFDFFVHLCRDYNFALFKLDSVCGHLRKEKAPLFAKMLRECRKYSPDLIVLNHRLDLYEAEKHITTYLWNGEETYTDVFTHNEKTGMHGRVYMFSRGHVDSLDRMAEDHGVCLSSSLDYFDDELIYQSFGRCLILAPEIYGNPWFLKDEEFSKLAYVYNLHKRNAPLLTNGTLLPESYGCNAISRGDKARRFVLTGNDTWQTKTIKISFAECGIETDKKVSVIRRFPTTEFLGEFNADDTIEAELLPFRATLFEIGESDTVAPYIPGKCCEVIKEDAEGNCLEYKEITEKTVPAFLASSTLCPKGGYDALQLFESAMFACDNDALEARCMKRSGETAIPAVRKARQAFFDQKTYRLRGCENKNLFDGNDETFFDSQSKTYCGGFRINGGCLRIDAGEVIDADCVEIVIFECDNETEEVRKQQLPIEGEFSADLSAWHSTAPAEIDILKDNVSAEIVKFKVHTTYELPGKMLRLRYNIGGRMRYIKFNCPPDRIHSVKFYNNGKEIALSKPFANNLMSPYIPGIVKAVKKSTFTLPQCRKGSYIALAVEGEHGAEGVYCTAQIGDILWGAPRRAPDYRANVWEHIVCSEKQNNTFYFPLNEKYSGKEMSVFTLFTNDDKEDIECNAYLIY